MSVVLTYCRHGKRHTRNYSDVVEAAEEAVIDSEFGEIYPVKIEEGGAVIWESNSPFDGSMDRLREIAGMDD